MRRLLLVGASFLLLGLVAYGNATSVPFQFDDRPAIVENATLRDPWDLRAIAAFQPTRCLVFFSFALNHAIHGLDVFGYHVVNLALHGAAALALFVLVMQVCRMPRCAAALGGQAPLAAACAAGLFLVHPIQTQAVTYIQQRSACMVGFLYLATLTAWLSFRTAAAAGRDLRATALAWLAVAGSLAAMLTKENAFTLPLAALLLERFGFGPSPRVGSRARLALLATMLVIPAVTLVWGNAQADHIRELSRAGPLTYFVTQWSVLVRYLRLVVWPTGQSLEHGVPWAEGVLDPAVLASGALLGGLLGLAWMARRRRPLLALGLGFFFLAHTVESSFLPLADAMFEQRMYLPMAGLGLAFADLFLLALAGLRASWRVPLAYALLTVLLLGLAGLAHARNRVWQSAVSLHEEVVARYPTHVRGLTGLGNAYAGADRHADALRAYRRAVELEPNDVTHRYHHLTALLKTGGIDAARAEVAAIGSLAPGSVIEAYSRGLLHLAAGELEPAAAAFERSLGARGGDATAIPREFILRHLVVVHRQLGRAEEALRYLEPLLERDPDDPQLHRMRQALERERPSSP